MVVLRGRGGAWVCDLYDDRRAWLALTGLVGELKALSLASVTSVATDLSVNEMISPKLNSALPLLYNLLIHCVRSASLSSSLRSFQSQNQCRTSRFDSSP